MNRIKTPPDNNKSKEAFTCGTCEHGIPVRHTSRKVVCTQTLDLHETDNIASCEHARGNKSNKNKKRM